MAEWFETRSGLWSACWRQLVRDAVLLKPNARSVLATIGRSGAPEARMVVLRGADRRAGSVAVHTDTGSVKITELTADPRASLHIWNESTQVQMRLRGTIQISSGLELAHLWHQMPDGSRANYGVTPVPGSVIDASDAYVRAPDPDRLARLTLRIDEMDVVHLSDDYHRRALYRRDDDWQGQWLAP
jgi:pyridoxine/pyridoxamine 5'-phosphate oxidase